MPLALETSGKLAKHFTNAIFDIQVRPPSNTCCFSLLTVGRFMQYGAVTDHPWAPVVA